MTTDKEKGIEFLTCPINALSEGVLHKKTTPRGGFYVH
jgi:hypothetical protein